jgi:hypothetical protein
MNDAANVEEALPAYLLFISLTMLSLRGHGFGKTGRYETPRQLAGKGLSTGRLLVVVS